MKNEQKIAIQNSHMNSHPGTNSCLSPDKDSFIFVSYVVGNVYQTPLAVRSVNKIFFQ